MKPAPKKANVVEANRAKVLAATLEELLSLYSSPGCDVSDRETFKVILQSAVSEGGIQPSLIASHFKVNHGTISRWLAGKTSPISAARGAIAGWLISEMRAEKNRLKGRK